MQLARFARSIAAGMAFLLVGPSLAVNAGDCGQGTPPVPSCYARRAPAYPCCCPPCCYGCCHKCCGRGTRDRGASRGAEEVARAASPVVSSMPVFSTPMMFASMPVVPTMLQQRAAEPVRGAELDCHERIDRLEENVRELAQAVRELQVMVLDQGRVLEKISERELGAIQPTPEEE